MTDDPTVVNIETQRASKAGVQTLLQVAQTWVDEAPEEQSFTFEINIREKNGGESK